MGYTRQHRRSTLAEFRRALYAGRDVIAGVLVGSTLFGLALNAWVTPVYRATTRLEILLPLGPLGDGGGVLQSENIALFTAAMLITGRDLLASIDGDVAGRDWLEPGLWSDQPRVRVRALARAAGSYGGLMRPLLRVREVRERASATERVDWLRTIVHVEPVPNTRLVDIHVEHPLPEAARGIADRLAERFVAYAAARAVNAVRPTGQPAPVEIVDHAWLEARPIRPRKFLDLAACVGAGAFIGCVLAILRYSGGRTLRSAEEVEEQLQLPVLAVLPRKP